MFLYKEFNKKRETSFQRGNKSKTNYKTIQVHREYGINDIPHARMDLCLLKKEEIKDIDDPNLKKENKYLIPFFGIELGTEKTPKFEEHIKKDITKLKSLRKAYLIYIFKDTAISAKSKDRGIKTGKKFETIKSVIKEMHECFVLEGNIIPLFFILKLKKEQKPKGKCEYFDYKLQNWKLLALKEIESIVKKQLE
jgi:hypothetical protein